MGRTGEFPTPIRRGKRATVFRESEVEDWMNRLPGSGGRPSKRDAKLGEAMAMLDEIERRVGAVRAALAGLGADG